MHKKYLIITTVIFLCVAAAFSAGCTSSPTAETANITPTVEILYTGAGTMPGLLATGTVDGYMIWQPFVAVGVEGDIGKVVSYSQDLPPKGMWINHTCCVFGANTEALKNEDMTTVLTGLMLLGNQYINENQEKAAELTADWLFASNNMTYGDVTVSSVDAMKASIPTIEFSSTVTDSWRESNYEFLLTQRELGTVTKQLATTSETESEAILYDFTPYEAAVAAINAGKFTTPAVATSAISIGYLPSDHDAPLFVLLKDWTYFRDNYNTYMKPVQEKTGKITEAELYVNGERIAELKLVEGSGGPQLMTLLSQNTIQYAIAGTPPFITAIDASTGNVGLKILSPIMLDGSGLVVSLSSPANDWDSFVAWIKERSAAGDNVVIADPQLGSIQDVQLKAALDDAGIAFELMK